MAKQLIISVAIVEMGVDGSISEPEYLEMVSIVPREATTQIRDANIWVSEQIVSAALSVLENGNG